jgi:hypothetical protein
MQRHPTTHFPQAHFPQALTPTIVCPNFGLPQKCRINGCLPSPYLNRLKQIVIDPKTVALVLVLISAARASGQDGPCSVKLVDLQQAPELMGFQLGMTTDQIKARVPQVVFGQTDDLGSSKTTINPDFDPRINKTTFPGVRTVSLDFLDGRLTSLWLGYDGTFKWQSVDDFVKGISQSLRLTSVWLPWRSRGQQLKCVDFQITITLVADGPSFRIVDQSAEDTLAARRDAKAEQESTSAEGIDESQEILGDKDSKTYYTGGCQPAKEIAESNRVVFKNRGEADRAGYRRAKDCQ